LPFLVCGTPALLIDSNLPQQLPAYREGCVIKPFYAKCCRRPQKKIKSQNAKVKIVEPLREDFIVVGCPNAKCCRGRNEETYSEYAEGIQKNKYPSRRQHKQNSR
jgi:hypothetical protein